jgi:cation:H+ antiporter
MKPVRRIAVLVAGSAVLVAGAVMLVTPGPGIAVGVLGLTILGTEFRWARYLLVRLKRRAVLVARRVRGRRGPQGGHA